MRGAERLARRLKTIGHADDFRQPVVAKGDVLINICAGDGLSSQLLTQGSNRRRALIHVGDNAPFPLLAVAQCDAIADEIRPAPAVHLPFRLNHTRISKGIKLDGRQHIIRLIEPIRPRHRRRQRLAGFSLVGQQRTHGVYRQARFQIEFVFLVGVDQTTQFVLSARRCAIGKQVLHTIEQIDV